MNEYVIDTTVLQKANAAIHQPPRSDSLFVRRVALLNEIHEGKKIVLWSNKLLAEYRRQVRIPRNDFVRLFFELLADPRRARYHWASWSGRDEEKARRCRYPREDDHVLRTAARPDGSTIVTEERRMLQADVCIHRAFRVHIKLP
ncbi:MAG: hypothetical protein HY815_28510 [Candidatus Riflebacteria bacterium]|nr:hypothetical protein [Candidatus Riflebacteria bacterium]